MITKFIVIDTETANTLDDPFTYDIGFAVVDIEGNVYEKYSFVVADIFLDKELMKSAYFADKIPQYWEDIMVQRIRFHIEQIENLLQKFL